MLTLILYITTCSSWKIWSYIWC